MRQESVDRMEKALLSRKKELLDRMRINDDTWSAVHEKQIEFEEQAANEALAEQFEGADERIIGQLRQIERALQKIRTQEYGTCESCGGQIDSGRLQAIPYTTRCIRCAGESEPAATVSEYTEEPRSEASLPPDFEGLDNVELAWEIKLRLNEDARIPTDELDISCSKGIIVLRGSLPSEKTREILLQLLTDTLGFQDIEDHLVIDPELWEKRSRTPGVREGMEKAADTGYTETPDAAESRKSGLPMEPPDEFIPEDEGRRRE